MTWGDILDGARQSKPGYRTIRKLLSQKGYDR